MARRSLKKLSLGLLLAGLLVAGSGSAQSSAQPGEAENPHSTQNADRTVEQVPAKTTAEETEAAERGNPHSTMNADRPAPAAPADAATRKAQFEAAESGNPDSVLNGKRMKEMGSLLQRLHVVNLAEVDAGRLAQANGGTRSADYGRMLVDDHTKADEKLMEVASKMKMKLSEEPSDKSAMADQADAKKTADKLQPLHGAAFDKEFSKEMEAGHKKAISMVETARPTVKDPGFAAVLDEMLPTLKRHQAMAHDLRTPMAQGRSVH